MLAACSHRTSLPFCAHRSTATRTAPWTARSTSSGSTSASPTAHRCAGCQCRAFLRRWRVASLFLPGLDYPVWLPLPCKAPALASLCCLGVFAEACGSCIPLPSPSCRRSSMCASPTPAAPHTPAPGRATTSAPRTTSELGEGGCGAVRCRAGRRMGERGMRQERVWCVVTSCVCVCVDEIRHRHLSRHHAHPPMPPPRPLPTSPPPAPPPPRPPAGSAGSACPPSTTRPRGC